MTDRPVLFKKITQGEVLFYNQEFGPPKPRDGVALSPVLEHHLKRYLRLAKICDHWYGSKQYYNSDYFGNDGSYYLGVILSVMNGWYFLYIPSVPFLIVIKEKQLRSVPLPWSPMLCAYPDDSPLVLQGMGLFNKIPKHILIRFLQ